MILLPSLYPIFLKPDKFDLFPVLGFPRDEYNSFQLHCLHQDWIQDVEYLVLHLLREQLHPLQSLCGLPQINLFEYLAHSAVGCHLLIQLDENQGLRISRQMK